MSDFNTKYSGFSLIKSPGCCNVQNVEPLYKGHLGDTGKWPLSWCGPCREVAVIGRLLRGVIWYRYLYFLAGTIFLSLKKAYCSICACNTIKINQCYKEKPNRHTKLLLKGLRSKLAPPLFTIIYLFLWKIYLWFPTINCKKTGINKIKCSYSISWDSRPWFLAFQISGILAFRTTLKFQIANKSNFTQTPIYDLEQNCFQQDFLKMLLW